MNWYLDALKNYAVFGGRARRKAYWLYTLITWIIIFILAFIDGMIGTFNAANSVGVLSGLYWLATLLPSLGVTVRRLHDTERSGWWIFISLIPLVGGIILLVFLCQDSQKDANEYGPNPKEAAPV
jgi:uncharacterized membrane protein YhaH (DUF805 family)